MTRPVQLSVLVAALLSAGRTLPAQDDSAPAGSTTGTVSLPLPLDLSRRDLKNFLDDEEALAPFRAAGGEILELRDVFTIGSVEAPYAVFWDARTCRLVGAIDLKATPPSETPKSAEADGAEADGEKVEDAPQDEAEPSPEPPSPYLLKAVGPHPLAATAGASERPEYFGFRLVEGRPEFLYHCGLLSVEERIWLEEGGRVLRQRYAVAGARADLRIAVPGAWAGRVEASAGSWKDRTLTVPIASAGEILLTYPLAPPAPAPQANPSDPN